MKLALLALLSFAPACSTPPAASIGVVEWTTRFAPVYRQGDVGRGGDIALIAENKLALFTTTGALRWEVPCDPKCVQVAVDAAGNVFVVHDTGASTSLLAHAAADGAVLWSRPMGSRASAVTVTADDTVWSAHATFKVATLDHYTNDGTLLGSVAIPVVIHINDPISLQEDPGGVVLVAETLATAIADDLSVRWTLPTPRTVIAMHGNGEMTTLDEDSRLTRRDAARNVRWRRHSVETLLPIAENWLLAGFGDKGRDYYQLIDPDGSVQAEEVIEGITILPAHEGTRMVAIDYERELLVSRQLTP